MLYRVITGPTKEDTLGSVGIHLHSWSARLPSDPSRKRIIAPYESSTVPESIRSERLVGEPVEADLILRTPVPHLALDPTRVELIVAVVRSGPPEDAMLGSEMFEDDVNDDAGGDD